MNKKFLCIFFLVLAPWCAVAQLTNGWTEVPYQFIIQSPYNLPMWDRYGYDPASKTHTFTVRSGDALHFPQSQSSGPRSEMMITGYNYKSIGSHQIEADFNVTPGTDATCILQIKGGSGGNGGTSTNTFIMLRIYGNDLCDNHTPIMPITKGQWYHLNVIHNAETGNIRVFVDGVQRLSRGSAVDNSDRYFKVGVYNQSGAAALNETKFRNIRMWELYSGTKQHQTVTFPPLPAAVQVGTPDFSPGATASSGLPITYITAYEPVITFVNGKIHVNGDGYANVAATQPGNSAYHMAPNALQFLVVTSPSKRTQTISCDPLPAKQVGSPDFSTGAVASSGKFLKVFSSNRAVATVTHNNTIHIEGPGTTTLTFLQVGDSTYNAAVIYRTLVVNDGAPVEAPVFSPGGGTYTSAQNVTVSTATAGASIRYTLDGTEPSATVGIVYAGPVAITGSRTLKAIAYKSGLANSPVTTANYVINKPANVTFEAESLTRTTSGPAVTTGSDTKASGGVVCYFNSTAAGQWVEFTTPSVAAGVYQLRLAYKHNVARGRHTVAVDGGQVGGTIDQYASTSGYTTVTVGTVTFNSAGVHRIRLTVTGKNSAATDYDLAPDAFLLIAQ